MSTVAKSSVDKYEAEEQLLAERLALAVRLVGDSVEINSVVRSGVPVLRGTRFPLSQVLAELAAGRTIGEISDDWELDKTTIVAFLEGLSIQLDRPFRP